MLNGITWNLHVAGASLWSVDYVCGIWAVRLDWSHPISTTTASLIARPSSPHASFFILTSLNISHVMWLELTSGSGSNRYTTVSNTVLTMPWYKIVIPRLSYRIPWNIQLLTSSWYTYSSKVKHFKVKLKVFDESVKCLCSLSYSSKTYCYDESGQSSLDVNFVTKIATLRFLIASHWCDNFTVAHESSR